MKRTSTVPCGYSGDTEVLTRTGWVKFPQLTYMSEVATRSADGAFNWQYPEKITCQPYEGEMVWLHSRTTDSLVTPDCPVLYLERRRVMRGGVRAELAAVEQSATAGSLVGGRLSLVATSRWEPRTPKLELSFSASRAETYGGRLARRGHPFTASADDFAAFMGMYLAEGNLGKANCTGYYRIDIWQKHGGRGFREYQDLLNRILGREVPHHGSSGGGWHFENKALYEYLKPCGAHAWCKRIPAEVLDLPAASLEKFWRFYCLGDGTTMRAEGRKDLDAVSTSSPELADGLQEVLQKLGGWALIQVIDFRKYEASNRFRVNHLTHRLVRRAGLVAFASEVDRAPYRGLVGNVHVGGRAVYVRRNNRPVWSGMS